MPARLPTHRVESRKLKVHVVAAAGCSNATPRRQQTAVGQPRLPRHVVPRDAVRLAPASPAGLTAPLRRPPWPRLWPAAAGELKGPPARPSNRKSKIENPPAHPTRSLRAGIVVSTVILSRHRGPLPPVALSESRGLPPLVILSERRLVTAKPGTGEAGSRESKDLGGWVSPHNRAPSQTCPERAQRAEWIPRLGPPGLARDDKRRGVTALARDDNRSGRMRSLP